MKRVVHQLGTGSLNINWKLVTNIECVGHPGPAKSEPAFKQVSQDIHIHIDIGEVLVCRSVF
jgi:hypothetical protein